MERQLAGRVRARRVISRKHGHAGPWPWHACLAMAALATGLTTPGARGDQFFVSAAGGNDAGPGSAAQPWATLQHAADVVEHGDRVTVRPGAYAGFYLETTGMAGSPIEFFAEPGVLITEDNGQTEDGINLEGASHIVIDGFGVTGMGRAGVRSVLGEFVTIRNVLAYDNDVWGIFTGFVDDLLIENNETSGSIDEHGIYVSNSGDRPVIRNNYSWGNHGSGIHMNGDVEQQPGDGIISNALVSGNRIFNNAVSINGSGLGGGSGINMDGVVNSRIENNLVYGNHASGISLYMEDGATGSTGNVVVNNTVHQPGDPDDDDDGRWALNIQDGSSGSTVRNNILVTEHDFRGALDISPASLSGLTSDYNVVASRFTNDEGDNILTLAQWQAATGQDAHSLVAAGSAAALFVNPATGDYRLKPGALAIDKGTTVGAPAVDLVGRSRSQGATIDVGAIETPNLAADFTSDARVDAADLAAWRSGFGITSGAKVSQGNADADRDVDGRDFLVWQQQRGAGVGLPGAVTVPEPVGSMMVIVALSTLLIRPAQKSVPASQTTVSA